MSKVNFFNVYKLKKGADTAEFLVAVKALEENHISKQKGFVSFQLMNDGDTWADSTIFESMEDAKAFANASDPSGSAQKFYGFLNCNSCKSNFFTIQE